MSDREPPPRWRRRWPWAPVWAATMAALTPRQSPDVWPYLGVDEDASTNDERGDAIDAALRAIVAAGRAATLDEAVPVLLADAVEWAARGGAEACSPGS